MQGGGQQVNRHPCAIHRDSHVDYRCISRLILKYSLCKSLANFANICHGLDYWSLSMATLNISMPKTMREWIDAQIKAGEYANASDYIRDLIRHDQRQRDTLRLALIEGEKSGVSQRSATDIGRNAKRRLKRA